MFTRSTVLWFGERAFSQVSGVWQGDEIFRSRSQCGSVVGDGCPPLYSTTLPSREGGPLKQQGQQVGTPTSQSQQALFTHTSRHSSKSTSFPITEIIFLKSHIPYSINRLLFSFSFFLGLRCSLQIKNRSGNFFVGIIYIE